MTPNEYQELAMKTSGQAEFYERLTMGVMGLSGETGEVADIVKKFLFHDHDLDTHKLHKEIGDVLWYVALLCETLGFKLEEVMIANIEKLRKRYPAGFSAEASKNRIEYLGNGPLVEPAPDAFPLHYRSPYVPGKE